MLSEVIGTTVSALAVSLLLVPLMATIAKKRRLLDVPNERSSHKIPTPRIGGVGIVAGAMIAWFGACMVFDIPLTGEMLGVGITLAGGALVGFVDDILGLRTALRLLLYLGCALCAASFGAATSSFHLPGVGAIPLGSVLGTVFSVLFIAWYTNLFNFMDGINGIAGGTSIVTMSALAVLYGRADATAEALLASAISAASLGFLFFNIPKAKVFMGDGGAVFIGLAAGALSIGAVGDGLIGTDGALLLMYPFVFDATFTLCIRILKRERFWAAHRTHVYQQLCDVGLSHVGVTSIYVVLSAVCALFGLMYHRFTPPMAMATWALLLAFSFVGTGYVLRRNRGDAA